MNYAWKIKELMAPLFFKSVIFHEQCCFLFCLSSEWNEKYEQYHKLISVSTHTSYQLSRSSIFHSYYTTTLLRSWAFAKGSFYKFLAIISCAAISCLNLVMNSSARSSIPCIWGDAKASDSHTSSEAQDLPPFVVPSCPESLLVRGLCAVCGFNCSTESHEGSLKSLSMYTGAGFLWNPKIKLLTEANLLWRKKRLVTTNLGGVLEVASLAVGFECFLDFFMALDLDLLSLPIVEVKLFHAFLAGRSLSLSFRLMQDFMIGEEWAMLQIRRGG